MSRSGASRSAGRLRGAGIALCLLIVAVTASADSDAPIDPIIPAGFKELPTKPIPRHRFGHKADDFDGETRSVIGAIAGAANKVGSAVSGAVASAGATLSDTFTSYGKWCGPGRGGYADCCRGGPCPACLAENTTDGQRMPSIECLKQCPPMDDIDSACASHDKCINDGDSQYSSGWPTVLAVTARLTRSCSTLKNVNHFCGCDGQLVADVKAAKLPPASNVQGYAAASVYQSGLQTTFRTIACWALDASNSPTCFSSNDGSGSVDTGGKWKYRAAGAAPLFSPPPPATFAASPGGICYQLPNCNGGCRDGTQCTLDPFGKACAGSAFTYACDVIPRGVNGSGCWNFIDGLNCPPGTNWTQGCSANASFSWMCATPPSPPPGATRAAKTRAAGPSSQSPPAIRTGSIERTAGGVCYAVSTCNGACDAAVGETCSLDPLGAACASSIYNYACGAPPAPLPPQPPRLGNVGSRTQATPNGTCYEAATCNSACASGRRCVADPYGPICAPSAFSYSCNAPAPTETTSGGVCYSAYDCNAACGTGQVCNYNPFGAACKASQYSYACATAPPSQTTTGGTCFQASDCNNACVAGTSECMYLPTGPACSQSSYSFSCQSLASSPFDPSPAGNCYLSSACNNACNSTTVCQERPYGPACMRSLYSFACVPRTAPPGATTSSSSSSSSSSDLFLPPSDSSSSSSSTAAFMSMFDSLMEMLGLTSSSSSSDWWSSSSSSDSSSDSSGYTNASKTNTTTKALDLRATNAPPANRPPPRPRPPTPPAKPPPPAGFYQTTSAGTCYQSSACNGACVAPLQCVSAPTSAACANSLYQYACLNPASVASPPPGGIYVSSGVVAVDYTIFGACYASNATDCNRQCAGQQKCTYAPNAPACAQSSYAFTCTGSVSNTLSNTSRLPEKRYVNVAPPPPNRAQYTAKRQYVLQLAPPFANFVPAQLTTALAGQVRANLGSDAPVVTSEVTALAVSSGIRGTLASGAATLLLTGAQVSAAQSALAAALGVSSSRISISQPQAVAATSRHLAGAAAATTFRVAFVVSGFGSAASDITNANALITRIAQNTATIISALSSSSGLTGGAMVSSGLQATATVDVSAAPADARNFVANVDAAVGQAAASRGAAVLSTTDRGSSAPLNAGAYGAAPAGGRRAVSVAAALAAVVLASAALLLA